jgi:hypothetical protein
MRRLRVFNRSKEKGDGEEMGNNGVLLDLFRFRATTRLSIGPHVFNQSKEKGDGEEHVEAVNAFRVGTGESKQSL